MIFATLREDREDGGWDWDSMANHRLSYALVEISCYPIKSTKIDDNASIRITTARGWNGEDIYNCLVEHTHPTSIVSEVRWNDRITEL